MPPTPKTILRRKLAHATHLEWGHVMSVYSAWGVVCRVKLKVHRQSFHFDTRGHRTPGAYTHRCKFNTARGPQDPLTTAVLDQPPGRAAMRLAPPGRLHTHKRKKRCENAACLNCAENARENAAGDARCLWRAAARNRHVRRAQLLPRFGRHPLPYAGTSRERGHCRRMHEGLLRGGRRV